MASIRLWSKILVAALSSKSNQEFYDRISPIYDQCFVTHKLHATNMAEILVADYKGQEQNILVLDLGCGTGLLSNILVSKGFKVFGMDISFKSLRLLQQREPEIKVVQADAALFPFADRSCHAVVSLGAWRHFSDHRRVISEVARVLKDDGMLIVGYFPPAIGGVVQQGVSHWRKWLARLYQFLIRERGYVDHIDQSLEPMTVSLAKDQFKQINTVDSGEHWRLIIAREVGQA